MTPQFFGSNGAFNSPSRERLSFPGGLIQECGIARRIRDFVRDESVAYLVIDSAITNVFSNLIGDLDADVRIEVTGEPSTRDVLDLVANVKSSDAVDFIAVGGGSTIDRAKALLMLRATGHVSGFGYGRLRRAAESFNSRDRVLAVPTLCGSGAETSRYVVLTDDDGRKRPSRSWKLVPELILLDPLLLDKAPENLLIMGAFDAFVHSWETLINREEFSRVLAPLARENVRSIMNVVKNWINGSAIDRRLLQMAAAVGGILISNTRVGLMHTLGESYARFVHVPHPESLARFLPAVAASYDVEFVQERTGLNVQDVLGLWDEAWSRLGMTKPTEPFDHADELADMVMEDRVLVAKEHPGDLDRDTILRMIRASV